MDNKIKSTNGILILENETPEDVALAMIESGQQKEPFYVFDIDEAYRRVQHFKEMLPRVQIFYAMKSNDNERMVKLAVTLGLGFDCASPGEINKILKLNLSPLSIIFAVASKPPYWMTYARSSGVRHTTFDSSCELKKIKQYWPDARLLIRIKVDGNSLYMLGDKFGCDFETEAIDLLEEAAALNLKVVGVAFHVGSGCFSIESHMIGLRRTRTLFDHEAKAGRKMNIVNIGGGFLSDRTDSIDQVSKLINSTLEELFPDPTIQVIAEPGRYICDSSSSMYCSVNNVRKVTKGDETINMIYLNDGIFGSLKYNEPWHTVKLFERRAEIKGDVAVKSILWGPSCHAHDRIMNNVDVFLPQCTPFDWLIFPRRGAYALAFASSFSSIQTPLVRSVISQELWKKIKDNAQFISEEFVRTDISSPLPSTLPPITNSTSSNRPNYILKEMDNKIKSTNGILILENETPEDVAKAMIESGQQKEPFYVFDIDEAYRRVEHFKKMLPRVQIFYAMKSNDNERMIKLAATLGLGFDCASPGEINKILKLNLSPLSIIFAVTSKSPYWMTYARSSGVRHTTFDSSCELKKIKLYWPDARLLIRIKVDGDSIHMLGDKFGCDFETEAIDLLEEAAALNLKVVGVAFHVGSGCFSTESHMIGLRRTRTLFDHEAKAGRKMYIVNIGGGFLSDRTDSIDQVSKLINSTLEELFPDPTIQVIAEPGRYICDSSSSMYCSVNNVRKVRKGDETVNMIYLNDGIFGSLKYNEPWHTVKLFERRAEIKADMAVKTILWGPSCNPHDQIMNNVDVFLPQCTPFDWLIFPRRGAYALAFATSFSSIETPLVRSVISQELWKKIKDSEQFKSEEFVRTDISSPLPSTLPPIKNSISSNRPNYTLKV